MLKHSIRSSARVEYLAGNVPVPAQDDLGITCTSTRSNLTFDGQSGKPVGEPDYRFVLS